MTPEAHALRDEITEWCIAHKVNPNYQAHMNYDVRSRIVDSWVLSHAGLLLIPEPTDGTAYFLDSASNQVTLRQSMTTNPLELFHRMSIQIWSALVGGDLPSRNLERNFYTITKLDDQGLPMTFGWEPSLVSHFPDFGAFGYEAILDILFTGLLPTSHAHTRPLRVSRHAIEIMVGETKEFNVRVKGGQPPYSYAVTGGAIAVTQMGKVTLTIPDNAQPQEIVTHVIVTDFAGRREQATIQVTILPRESA